MLLNLCFPEWLSVRGKFMAVNSAVISCTCRMTEKGISPSQHLGNGYCDVIIVSSCSRLDYINYLLRTSYHHKDPVRIELLILFIWIVIFLSIYTESKCVTNYVFHSSHFNRVLQIISFY